MTVHSEKVEANCEDNDSDDDCGDDINYVDHIMPNQYE
jgi:hypothetical protein